MATCKSCGAEIIWEKTEQGRWRPMDLNGKCHFDTCPKAEKYRKTTHKSSCLDYSRINVPDDQKQLYEFDVEVTSSIEHAEM